MLEIEFGGARLQLLAQRAAYLPQQRTLLVADAHIGKAHSFRRLGVPVPRGTTDDALARLQVLVRTSGAQHLVFLGDLLHAARGRSGSTLAAVAQWRAGHQGLDLWLVRGNHDRHAGDPPADWGVRCVEEPFFLPGLPTLAMTHHPQAVAGACVLAGHVHPAVALDGRAHQRLRLPCFHIGPALGLLPAFGDFTGVHVMPRGPQDRVFAIAGDTVRALPPVAAPINSTA